MNLAAKLEKHCKHVGRAALATAAAWQRAQRQGLGASPEWECLPRQTVAGLGSPLDLVAHAAPRGAPRVTLS